MRKIRPAVVMLALIAAACFVFMPEKTIAGEREGTGCNVLIILVDALRFDHLGCYGYEKNTSPHMDRVFNKGILFKNAVSQATWTKPAVMSLFTSNYLHTHNIERGTKDFSVGGADNILPESAETLTEVLSRNGYRAHGIVGNYFIQKGFGVEQGFDEYEIGRPDREITETAIHWLGENRESPFFLYLHYMGPHTPYDPPEEYRRRFAGSYKGSIEFEGKHAKHFKKMNLSDEDLTELRARYDAEIAAVDDEVGRVLEYLETRGLAEKTVVVLLADHGEALMENKYIGHGPLTNTVAQIPLGIFNPKDEGSKKRDYVVEIIDVAPTILSILGIDIPEEFQGQNIREKGKRYGFCEMRSGKLGIRSEKYFYVNNGSVSRLYNIKEDPYEQKDISGEREKVLRDFEKAHVGFKKLAKRKLESKALDRETVERLKSLGYVK